MGFALVIKWMFIFPPNHMMQRPIALSMFFCLPLRASTFLKLERFEDAFPHVISSFILQKDDGECLWVVWWQYMQFNMMSRECRNTFSCDLSSEYPQDVFLFFFFLINESSAGSLH